MDWMDRNQVGRRNLSNDDFRLIVGRIYNRTKKAAHRPKKGGKSVPLNTGNTAETLAQEHGVSDRTIKRYGKFAETVEKVQQETPEVSKQGRQVLFDTARDQMNERARANLQARKEREAAAAEKEVVKEKPRKDPAAKDEGPPQYSMAMQFAKMAVADLKQIHHSYPDKEEAFDYVLGWIKKNR